MATTGKQIESKLATYKNGQLMCILCNVNVKNEMFWTGHVKGKAHLTNVMQLKRKAESGGNEDARTSGSPAKKVRISESSHPVPSSSGHTKSILKTTQQSQHLFKPPKPVKPILSDLSKKSEHSTRVLTPSEANEALAASNRSFLGSLESEEEEEERMDVEQPDEVEETKTEPSVKPGNSKATPKKADLPEGFFDDPKEDAKVRGIEFVDPEEAEWSRFMKEIATEEVQSESIQVVDEEESRKERELEEVEEMMTHWQKVIDLEKKKETRVKKPKTQGEDMESSDEEDVDEDLDWRVKKISQSRL